MLMDFLISGARLIIVLNILFKELLLLVVEAIFVGPRIRGIGNAP